MGRRRGLDKPWGRSLAKAEAAEEVKAAGGDAACSGDGSRSSSERVELRASMRGWREHSKRE